MKATHISRIEKGISEPREETLQKLVGCYERAGIEFTANNGVCQSAQVQTRTFRGKNGFIQFAQLVLKTARESGGDICVSNVDERNWDKWLGDYHQAYLNEMASLKNFKSRILVQDGDDYHVAPYAEYRSIPADAFGQVPFYVCGNWVATILFDEGDCFVLVNENERIAEAQRKAFDALWQHAHTQDGSG